MDPEKKEQKMRKVKLATKLIINRMKIAAIIATSPIWIILYLCFRLSAIRKDIKEEKQRNEQTPKEEAI